GTYVFEQTFGYVLTAPHADETIPLYDCYIPPPSDDHAVSLARTCEDQRFLRTLGWIWKSPRPGAVPIYRCYSSTRVDHFVSTDVACEALGTMELLLGYVDP